jgi:hypothetical protein
MIDSLDATSECHMAGELWFYVTTVLICTGYALLIQSHPRWKTFFSIGLAGFIIGGAVLVYLDAKKREDVQTKIGQLERMLEVARNDAQKKESLIKDATEKAHLLNEQLQAKTEELSKLLQHKPQIEGRIKTVQIFPWQRASLSRSHTDNPTTAIGVLIFAWIENKGLSTTLANWELRIELPDHTIISAQKWPVTKTMRIFCQDTAITISKDEFLDAKNNEALQRTENRSGATVWMVKNAALSSLQTNNVSYTLTMKDNTGVVHALEKFMPAASRKCFGFDVLD